MSGNRHYTEAEDALLVTLFKRGKKLREIAPLIGRSFKSVQYRHARLKREESRERKYNLTLCWDCYHATNPENRCPWTSIGTDEAPLFKPVPGWTADRTTIAYRSGGNVHEYETYFVRKCPLFKRG